MFITNKSRCRLKIFALGCVLLTGSAFAGPEQELAERLFKFYCDQNFDMHSANWNSLLTDLGQDEVMKKKAANELAILRLLYQLEQKVEQSHMADESKKDIQEVWKITSQALCLNDLRKKMLSFYEQKCAQPKQIVQPDQNIEVLNQNFQQMVIGDPQPIILQTVTQPISQIVAQPIKQSKKSAEELVQKNSKNQMEMTQEVQKPVLPSQTTSVLNQIEKTVGHMKNALDVNKKSEPHPLYEEVQFSPYDFALIDRAHYSLLGATPKQLVQLFNAVQQHPSYEHEQLGDSAKADLRVFSLILSDYQDAYENLTVLGYRALIHERVPVFQKLMDRMKDYLRAPHAVSTLKDMGSLAQMLTSGIKMWESIIEGWGQSDELMRKVSSEKVQPTQKVEAKYFFGSRVLERQYLIEYISGIFYTIYLNFDKYAEIAQKSENFLRTHPKTLTPEDVFCFKVEGFQDQDRIKRARDVLIELIDFDRKHKLSDIKTQEEFKHYCDCKIEKIKSIELFPVRQELITDFWKKIFENKKYHFPVDTGFGTDWESVKDRKVSFSPVLDSSRVRKYERLISESPGLSEKWASLRDAFESFYQEQGVILGAFREDLIERKVLAERIARDFDAYQMALVAQERRVEEKLATLRPIRADMEKILEPLRAGPGRNIILQEVHSVLKKTTEIDTLIAKLEAKQQKKLGAQQQKNLVQKELNTSLILKFAGHEIPVERKNFDQEVAEWLYGTYAMGHILKTPMPEVNDEGLQEILKKDYQLLQAMPQSLSKKNLTIFHTKVGELLNADLQAKLLQHSGQLNSAKKSMK